MGLMSQTYHLDSSELAEVVVTYATQLVKTSDIPVVSLIGD